MSNLNPTAFISYSWEGDAHRAWVRELAARLMRDGINVTLDQWNAVPGDQLPHFMEQSITDNDFVLIICTPAYKNRSDQRAGGVGYEGDIITSEILVDRNHNKFIPILRGPKWEMSSPVWTRGKFYVNLNEDPYSEGAYSDLVSAIHQVPSMAPQVGTAPQRPQSLNISLKLEMLHSQDLGEIGAHLKGQMGFSRFHEGDTPPSNMRHCLRLDIYNHHDHELILRDPIIDFRVAQSNIMRESSVDALGLIKQSGSRVVPGAKAHFMLWGRIMHGVVDAFAFDNIKKIEVQSEDERVYVLSDGEMVDAIAYAKRFPWIV